MSEQPVAPADAPKNVKDPQEGVHPIVANPDQPVFPRPVGVKDDDLKSMGVDQGYVAPSTEQTDGTSKVFQEEEGARPANEPEGKPADPKAEEKNEASAKVAEANKATAPAPQKPQGSNS